MQLLIDDISKEPHSLLRAAAAFLLTITGDIKELDVAEVSEQPQPPVDTSADTKKAAAPPAPPAPVTLNLPEIFKGAGPAVLTLVPRPPTVPAVATAVAPAAVISTPPVPTPPTGGESASDVYDSAGLPWDARIHQKTKSVKKDGTWKLQKGADPTLVSTVVAELAMRRGAPSAGVVASSLGTTQTVAPGLPAVPAPPASVPKPPAPPAPPVDLAGVRTAFKDLMTAIVAGQTAGKLQPIEVQGIVQKHGSANMGAVAGSLDITMLKAMHADIDALLSSRV